MPLRAPGSSAAALAVCAAVAAAARDTGENAAGDRWPSGMRMLGLRACSVCSDAAHQAADITGDLRVLHGEAEACSLLLLLLI